MKAFQERRSLQTRFGGKVNWTAEQLSDFLRRGQKAQTAVAGSPVLNAAKENRLSSPKVHNSKYSIPVVLAFFKEMGLPEPVPEYQFDPNRKWRFDFCFVANKLAVECDGGLFSGGSHVRGAFLIRDHEKKNRAATMGYRILYCTPQTITTTDFADTIREALK